MTEIQTGTDIEAKRQAAFKKKERLTSSLVLAGIMTNGEDASQWIGGLMSIPGLEMDYRRAVLAQNGTIRYSGGHYIINEQLQPDDLHRRYPELPGVRRLVEQALAAHERLAAEAQALLQGEDETLTEA